ncbi:MAG: protein translocase subunit SecD, partial [Pseudomonadota bacterium]|nr:protein translocase subunit SecD [Pseudomonadota bacterium]
MNRTARWVYALLFYALLVGIVYTLPNLFGEAPAVQVSSAKSTVKIDATLLPRIEEIVAKAGLKADYVQFDGSSIKARFADLDAQRKASEALAAALNPDAGDPGYVVALNLVARSPRWLSFIRPAGAEPRPMYLGLDLRGGVHFLMQVDMKAALTQKATAAEGDARTLLRDKTIRHSGIARDGNVIGVRFRDHDTLAAARPVLQEALADFDWQESQDSGEWKLTGNLRPEAAKRVQEAAITQNISTLHNRVNELGVAEPVIQKQGADRVVVELPGVQDTGRAKQIIGRT